MLHPSRRLGVVRAVVALVAAGLAMIGTGGVALAHTAFDSSVPADGSTVEGPLSEVVVSFTNPAQPAGAGFELLDPDGTVRSPSSLSQTDGTSFVLTFDPPLRAGTYGLRWSVRAGDAHPIEGSFRFEVSGENAPSGATDPTSPTTTGVMTAPAGSMDMDADEHAAMTGTDETLDEFLDVDRDGNGTAALGKSGRTISMLGAVFGLGVLATLMWTMRGTRDELVSLVSWVRLGGLVLLTGGLIEYAGLAEADPTASFGTVLDTKAGLATALKMVGGLAVMLGFHRRAGRIVPPARSLSAAVATEPQSLTSDVVGSEQRPHGHRWTPTSTAALGMVGYALVLISFWFDGHTVTRGPWAVHALVNSVHVGAAAVWGGGVFAMTAVAWMRHHRSEPAGLAEMIVRFSSVATLALVAVIGAGSLMTWMVLDAPGDLFGTDWGRMLLAKTAVVALAAGLGGYNHFRLRPELQRRPGDPQLARDLRVTLSIESAAFLAIVVLTAILVASAT